MTASADKTALFAREIIIAAGADPDQARITAKAMVWNDLAGRMTQGLWRLPALARRLERGGINGTCKPSVVSSAPSMELLDGDGGDGFFLGHLAMSRAIELARLGGISATGVTNSNHFGTGAYFVELACRANMLGLAFSNSLPKQAPYAGRTRVFGTNPFAFGAPRQNGRSVLVDFATASSAGSTLRKIAEQGGQLPEGIVRNIEGKPTTNPADVAHGVLQSFGGSKGYGIALMIEILCGVITGAAMSHQIHSFFEEPSEPGNIGHFFVAIDISRWTSLSEYFQRFETLAQMIFAAGKDVRLPGEMRWQMYDRHIEKGLEYDKSTRKSLEELARQYGAVVPWR